MDDDAELRQEIRRIVARGRRIRRMAVAFAWIKEIAICAFIASCLTAAAHVACRYFIPRFF